MLRTTSRSAVLIPLLLLVACAGSPPADAPGADVTGVPFEDFGHVHGVATNPADGSVYVAAHAGVYRLDPTANTGIRMAGRVQDTMGFTAAGPDTFLGSGHPDLREDLPPNLGLIRSTDAGRTWDAVSLSGEADLHAMDTADDLIMAYDALSGRVISTTDGTTWETVAAGEVRDLAVAPDGTVWSVDAAGALATASGGAWVAADGPSEAVGFIDITPDGTLVVATPGGEVLTSSTDGVWQAAGSVPPGIQAVDVADRWLAVSATAVHESTDGGSTWTTLLTSSAPGEGP
ncbi:BNR/Asp-box repeat protein [Aeromicrobium marinum DSM 15272]|uniref:BNR/Asp-box repeat protein n=1 Tax=Aeromicrobium marinum DSM 15272 TaxID=585531 RepID=E2SCD1_9ACTN|nr:hypothetical protein [Aeromicrobium marinum]EFQ82884.1 BNR/Asp-box repeat protein [Aeromicrobium marinum DSM 15272]